MASRTSMPNPTAQVVADHPGLVKLGQVGWAAKGVVYTIAGVLAATVVFGSFGWSTPGSNEEASPNGAIKTIAGSPGGALLLWVLGLSMLLYAAWRMTSAVFPGGHDAEASAKRIGYVVSAVIYTTFAITAITLARAGVTDSAQGPDGNSKVTNLTGARHGVRHRSLADRPHRRDRDRRRGLSPREGPEAGRRGRARSGGDVTLSASCGRVASAPSVRSAAGSRSASSASSCSAPRSTSTPTRQPASTVRCDGWRWRRGASWWSPSSPSASSPTACSAWPRSPIDGCRRPDRRPSPRSISSSNQ